MLCYPFVLTSATAPLTTLCIVASGDLDSVRRGNLQIRLQHPDGTHVLSFELDISQVERLGYWLNDVVMWAKMRDAFIVGGDEETLLQFETVRNGPDQPIQATVKAFFNKPDADLPYLHVHLSPDMLILLFHRVRDTMGTPLLWTNISRNV